MCLWYHFKAFNEYGYIISAIEIVVLYMDIQMAVFPIFPRYKKLKKKKIVEIIEKKIHLSKAIIINLSRMKKSYQNHG